MLIDGKSIAAGIRAKLAEEIDALDFMPGLAVIIVGDNPASHVYVANKERAAIQVGIDAFTIRLPDTCTQDELIHEIMVLNFDKSVHGILVQLPLLAHIDQRAVISAIDPKKDVDGFHPTNVGKLVVGLPGLRPCTPVGCLKLIKTVREDLTGLNALVIGASNIVGKPMAQMLLAENCTTIQAHIHTQHIRVLARQANIIVAAAGVPGLVKMDWVQRGAIVIDVGINRVDGKIAGDVDPEVERVAQAMTPVPGGVGPMTIACLLENTLQAAKNA